ncbi:DUF6207 family protein [Streptomyces purpurascens]|uniref:DUF6207 family protein n=1 Tax=Streptomyces purpurascens TaxID=1924 RepID=UPI003C2C0B6D
MQRRRRHRPASLSQVVQVYLPARFPPQRTRGVGAGCRCSGARKTAFAIQELLAGRWATSTGDGTTRVPGEPGVRLRCYLDLRQGPTHRPSPPSSLRARACRWPRPTCWSRPPARAGPSPRSSSTPSAARSATPPR